MDKEIDKERLKKLNPIPLRLSKQTQAEQTDNAQRYRLLSG